MKLRGRNLTIGGILTVIVGAGCEGASREAAHQNSRGSEHETFSITYEVEARGIEERIYYFYDIDSSVSISGRRDDFSIHVGEPISTEYCKQYEYCVIPRNFPYYIIVRTDSDDTFLFDGLSYSRANSEIASQCHRYDVSRRDELVMSYGYCKDIGVHYVDFYSNREIVEKMRLVSFRGLGGEADAVLHGNR